MDFLKKVGQNIKFYREIAEMSQDELAKRTGYSGRGAISKIENGERDIANSKLKDIANALNVTVTQLLDENNRMLGLKFDTELAEAYHNADDTTKRLVAYALGLKDIMDKEG